MHFWRGFFVTKTAKIPILELIKMRCTISISK